MTAASDEPEAQAHARVERVFALLGECPALLSNSSARGTRTRAPMLKAELILFHARGVQLRQRIRAMEDSLTVFHRGSDRIDGDPMWICGPVDDPGTVSRTPRNGMPAARRYSMSQRPSVLSGWMATSTALR